MLYMIMAKKLNERKTEDIVRSHFKKDDLFETLIFEEQRSDISEINRLLKNASKKGHGRGMPEFIITMENERNLLIAIECKADILKHESEKRDKPDGYAVDGVLHYSSFLSKKYDVLSLAVSGVREDNIKVSYFIQRKGKDDPPRVFGNKLITVEDILAGLRQDKAKGDEKLEKLLDYSQVLNGQLHELGLKEYKRSLLISGILIALKNDDFHRSYAGFTNNKLLADTLINTIKEQLKDEELPGDKIASLMSNYNFINNDPSLTSKKETTSSKDLKELIDDIDENINSYVRTYKYYDVLGQFYIEFLKYANSDKGLGIILTPPHITDFFTDIVDIKTDDVIIDNCAGTGGFLVSAMKKMIEKCKGDSSQEQNIKRKQLYGIEKNGEMYSLAVSNMFLHGDGKSNIINGNCFSENIINIVKEKKPTVGFLNPPYKSGRGDREEFEFILNSLLCLEKRGQCVAIIPMSCVLAQSREMLRLKEKLLLKHTLKAVFSMPDELFHNSDVGVNTCIVVFEAHIPHPEKKKTFFGHFKEDGFYKRKTKGRFDYDKKWDAIKDEWLNLYINNKAKAGFSVVRKVNAADEWCAEAYMETDYSTLTQDDFQSVVKKYAAFNILNGE